MLKLLFSPSAWLGAAAGAGLMFSWAVFVHGPAQYRAGGTEKAAALDAATTQAIKELSHEADRAGGRLHLVHRPPAAVIAAFDSDALRGKANVGVGINEAIQNSSRRRFWASRLRMAL